MFDLLQKISKAICRRRQKQQVVVISDSNACPCSYYLSILNEISFVEVVHIVDTFSQDSLSKIRRLKNAPFIFFVHGDKKEVLCYFYDKSHKPSFIPSTWWKALPSTHHAYFHTCYGSNIVEQTNEISTKLASWTSYSGRLNGVISYDSRIKKINKDFLSLVVSSVRDKKNVQAVHASLVSAYMSFESSLWDDGRPIDGFAGFVAGIGSNIKSLKHS